VGTQDKVGEHHQHKRIARQSVGYFVDEQAGVFRKLDSFVTKEYTEGYAYNIHPFGVMALTPMLKAVKEVHMAEF